MRLSLLSTLLLSLTAHALQLPQLQPFLSALLADYVPPPSPPSPETTAPALLPRQNSNTCPTSYKNCANLGAANLCCASNAICSADYAGHVACCPSGAACSGTISGVITAGTVDGSGNLVGAGGAVATSTASGGVTTTQAFQTAAQTTTTAANGGLVLASTQSTVANGGQAAGSGFVLVGGTTVATPGAGVRGAEIPLIAQAILRVLEYIPL